MWRNCIRILYPGEDIILASLCEGIRVSLVLALVYSVNVSKDVRATGSSVFTVRTLVRPLPGVGPKVAIQIVLQSKAFATEEAGVTWPWP